jgi:hypothetical protein
MKINNFLFSTLLTFALPATALSAPKPDITHPLPNPNPPVLINHGDDTIIYGNIFLEQAISDCTKVIVSVYQYPNSAPDPSSPTAGVLTNIRAFGDYEQNNYCSYRIQTNFRGISGNYYLEGYYDYPNYDYQLGEIFLGTANYIYDKTINQDLHLGSD